MLKPAILFKSQLEEEFRKLYYSKSMFYYSGDVENCLPKIVDENRGTYGTKYQWAVLDDDGHTLLGFIQYFIDWTIGSVMGFGLISFREGHRAIVALEMLTIFKQFLHNPKLHRIEFRCVADNHVAELYKKTIEHYCKESYCYELHNRVFDGCGRLHNSYILEGLW